MSPKDLSENTQSERLRAEYKGAFEQWAVQVARLQAVPESDGPCNSVRKQAEQRAAQAETAYRSSRDRLTENMGLPASN